MSIPKGLFAGVLPQGKVSFWKRNLRSGTGTPLRALVFSELHFLSLLPVSSQGRGMAGGGL